MSNESFVYVTYIATTADKVWNALLDGELIRQYWGGNQNIASPNWEKGSTWKHLANDEKKTVRMVGEVLENVPQKRLVLTWADPSEAADKAKHSRLAMDIETAGEMVRLKITHEQLHPDMARKVSHGWPLVLCSLKSFLETGHGLNIWGCAASTQTAKH